MNKYCLNKSQKPDSQHFILNKMRENNTSLFKQFCLMKLHLIDYQSVLFDKTGGNNRPFFLILSNKNKQHADFQTL
ncbi:MAG TPA: hypothetical protein DIU39_00975 [Flavobacteriales bacterium]|nr:hypothetical protein [Flavobacteriales bacterium]|tara:strand:- start:11080 stop:11307 length:228 start_codon:yes stop_codon:yes gene_type:complete